MKNVFFDIECYKDLFLVSFLEHGKVTDFVFHKSINEKKREALRAYYERDDIRLIGFNSLRYDMPMVNRFLGKACGFESKDDILPQPDDLSTMKEMNDAIIAGTAEFYAWVPNSYDMKNDCGKNDALKQLAAKHNFDNLLETPIPFDVPFTTSDMVKDILRYCHNDVAMTEYVFTHDKKLQAQFHARLKLAELYEYHWAGAPMAKSFAGLAELTIHRLTFPESKTKPVLVERAIAHNFADLLDDKIVFQTPQLNDVLKTYKDFHYSTASCETPHMVCYLGNLRVQLGVGGIHADLRGDDLFVKTVKDDEYVVQFDVKAYYPSLIEQLNITPEGFKGLPNTVSTLKRLRAEAPTKDENTAYKLLVNAISGKLQDRHALLYSPQSYHQMTINGQLFLLELAEAIHLAGYSLPQINTDSVSVVCTDKNIGKVQELVKAWEEKYGFTMTQEDYHGFIQSNVNNYLATDENNEVIKCKGTVWGDYGSTETTTRPRIVTKMKVDYLLYGTPCKDNVGEPGDYVWVSKANKDRTWVIKDGEDKSLNVKGTNRLYIGKTGFEIGTVNDESGKYVSNAAGKRLQLVNANLGALTMDDIDHNAYVAMAEADLSKITTFQSNYQAEVYYDAQEDTPEELEYRKLVRKVLKKAKIIVKGSRGRCPDVNCSGNNDDKVASLFKGKMHCFKCDGFFSPYDLSQMGYDMMDLVATPATMPLESTTEPLVATVTASTVPVAVSRDCVSDIPEYVWDGKLGELADVLGKRDLATFIGLFSTMSHLFIDRGIYNFAQSDTRLASYVVLVAPPGAGKQEIGKIQHAGLKHLPNRRMLGAIASGQALKDAVFIRNEDKDADGEKVVTWTSKPTHLYIDEFVNVLNTGGKDGTNTFSVLTEYYDTIVGTSDTAQSNKTNAKGENTKEIKDCHVSLFGSLTPDDFTEKFIRGKSTVTGGLLSRFHVFYMPVDKEDKLFAHSAAPSDWRERLLDGVRDVLENGIALRYEWADAVPSELQAWLRRDGSYLSRITDKRAKGELTKINTRDGAKFARTALTVALMNGRSVLTKGDCMVAEWIMEYHEASLAYLSDVGNGEVRLNEWQLQDEIIGNQIEEYVVSHPNRTVRQMRNGLRPKKGYGDPIPSKAIAAWIKENVDNLKVADVESEEGGQLRKGKGYTWVE